MPKKAGQTQKREPRKKVLVVDDEADYREVISHRLRAEGYDILTASSGKEALATLKREKPDVVLLDIFMPGMDGLKVLKRIREFDKEIPIFIITAFSDQMRFSLADQLGASGFLVKAGGTQGSEWDSITAAIRVSTQYRASKSAKTLKPAKPKKKRSA